MTINIIDYAGNKTPIDIGDLDNVLTLAIRVITGDEILTVVDKNGKIDEYDSSDGRINNYFDDSYIVFNRAEGINLLEDPNFMEREDSYWR